MANLVHKQMLTLVNNVSELSMTDNKLILANNRDILLNHYKRYEDTLMAENIERDDSVIDRYAGVIWDIEDRLAQV